VQFVGSMIDNSENCVAKTPDWDLYHEGHAGFLAITIANSTILESWLSAAQPDIIFMLGTNDAFTGRSMAAYTKIVLDIRASNLNMMIAVKLFLRDGEFGKTN